MNGDEIVYKSHSCTEYGLNTMSASEKDLEIVQLSSRGWPKLVMILVLFSVNGVLRMTKQTDMDMEY